MKYFFVLFALCTCLSFTNKKSNIYLFEKSQPGLSKIIVIGERSYCVTNDAIFEMSEKGLKEQARFDFKCNDACVFEDGLALATNIGITQYSLANNSFKKILPDQIKMNINNIARDQKLHLWFSSAYLGAFMIDENNTVLTKVEAPAISSIACTPDGNIWIGTNIGLYKISASGKEISRYVEEGIEGFELPDNLVQRLFADETSNMWVMLDGTMAFIPARDFEGDIPSYNYVGNKDNTVYSIAKIPISSTSYLFATARGMMFTANLKGLNNIHTGEIHQTYSENASMLRDDIAEKPIQFKNDTVTGITNTGTYIWFTTAKGIWRISSKKLIKNIKTQKF